MEPSKVSLAKYVSESKEKISMLSAREHEMGCRGV